MNQARLHALVVAALHFPGAVRSLNNRAAHNASVSDRRLELADALGISKPFVLAALRLLPARTTYVVESGNRADASPLALQALDGYLGNLLLPRLQVQGEAQWLLCYGCDVATNKRTVWRRGSLVIARG